MVSSACADHASRSNPGWALVTGASSSIGAAIARAYARRGVPLILTARRVDKLEQLATELRSQVPVEVIAADLGDAQAPAALVAALVPVADGRTGGRCTPRPRLTWSRSANRCRWRTAIVACT